VGAHPAGLARHRRVDPAVARRDPPAAAGVAHVLSTATAATRPRDWRRRAGVNRSLSLVVEGTLAAVLGEDFPGDVVAVLLGVEHPPPVTECPVDGRAQDAMLRGVAVRDVHAGDLVVALVLEAGEAGEARIDSRRGVAPFGDEAQRRVAGVR